MGVIIPFKIAEQAGIRKHVLDIQAVAPAGMRTDDIRRKALVFQFDTEAKDRLPVYDGGFKVPQVMVGFRLAVPMRFKLHIDHPWNFSGTR